MRWGLALGVAATIAPSLVMAQSYPISAAPDFPACEWRQAEEAGPPGRAALFCKTDLGAWLRVRVDGLDPEIPAKAAAGNPHAMAILGASYRRRSVHAPNDGMALLERAAAKGDAFAMRELGFVADVKGSPIIVPEGATEAEVQRMERDRQANEARALSYYRQAAALSECLLPAPQPMSATGAEPTR